MVTPYMNTFILLSARMKAGCLYCLSHSHSFYLQASSCLNTDALILLHQPLSNQIKENLNAGNGRVVGEILKAARPRSTLFTGSQRVAEQITLDLNGKARCYDSV